LWQVEQVSFRSGNTCSLQRTHLIAMDVHRRIGRRRRDFQIAGDIIARLKR